MPWPLARCSPRLNLYRLLRHIIIVGGITITTTVMYERMHYLPTLGFSTIDYDNCHGARNRGLARRFRSEFPSSLVVANAANLVADLRVEGGLLTACPSLGEATNTSSR
jgi:hypothetical protein